jgi:protein-S-isoprenylcysteine O-methyltransferase Ste14
VLPAHVTALIYTWPYALVFWTVFLWAFLPESRIISRRGEPSSTAQDASSKRLIAVGQGVAVFAAFWIAARVPRTALADRAVWFWCGVALIVGGSLLRRHCWRMLGRSFTGAVIVHSDQAVVERGAYRYVRHPSYTAGILMFLGISLALGNWLGVIEMMATVSIVYGYRVHVEERALAAVIGEPYRQYMRRTKRFVPLVF